MNRLRIAWLVLTGRYTPPIDPMAEIEKRDVEQRLNAVQASLDEIQRRRVQQRREYGG